MAVTVAAAVAVAVVVKAFTLPNLVLISTGHPSPQRGSLRHTMLPGV